VPGVITNPPAAAQKPKLDLTVFDAPLATPLPKARRPRWDYAIIALMAVAACAALVPKLLGMEIGGAAASRSTPSAVADPGDKTGGMNMEEASERVSEARAALLAGRFDDAEDMLLDIKGDIGDESGASELLSDITRTREEFERAGSAAEKAAAERRWPDAAKALGDARKLAPLPADLLELEATVSTQLDAQRSIETIRARILRDELAVARTEAVAAAERYKTPELTALVGQIDRLIAKRAADAAKAAADAAAKTPPTSLPGPVGGGTTPPTNGTRRPAGTSGTPVSGRPNGALAGASLQTQLSQMGISDADIQAAAALGAEGFGG